MIPLSKFKIDLKRLKEIDKLMLSAMILLMIFGIINIYLASSVVVIEKNLNFRYNKS